MLEGAATREQIEEQLALEERMVRSGVDLFMSRYNAALEKGRLRETQPGSILLRTLINPLEGAIVEWIEAHSQGRGRRPVALAYMTALEPSVIAYLTLKSAFNSMTDRKMVQTAAKDLGRIIEDECWYREFKKQNPRRFKWAMDKVNELSTKVRARKILRGQGSRGNVKWTRWPEDHVIQLGTRLLELLRESTGIIEFQMVPTGKNQTPYLVCPTNTTMEWLEQAAEQLSVLHPIFWPMVIKPKPWTNPWDGGYWTEMRRELPLVKTRNKAYLEELDAVNPTEVYRAVNAMQETPWRINKRVLEVLEEAWHRQIEIGKLPAVEEYDLPPKPAGTPKSNPDEWKGWRNKAASIHKTNVKLKSKRLLARRIIEIAKDFSRYEQIFFPYQMDFRGRIYAMPNFLNPQGADHAKALLTFAEGKPINDGVAAGWLAVHGANCYGEDKISLEERVEWIEDHTDQILSVAEDPWGPEFEFWSNADEPWQFLAFCFEWAGFVTEGYGFVSSLPVMLDGSCNGLQHFSAILRDEVGGKSVNLTPSEAPSDIYREVADVVKRKLADIIETGDEEARDLAEKWCQIGVTRKTTKTPVMTLPYGSTRYACREFLEEEIRKTGFNPFYISEQNDGIYRATLFLAPIVWESIGEAVKSSHLPRG